MKRTLVLCLVAAAVAGCFVAIGEAQGRVSRVAAVLEPEQEVPAGLSVARGRFAADVDAFNERIDYTLAYEGLEGSVVQAHIHIAQPGVNGGIMVWLCATPSSPGPAGTPACPPSGQVEGTLEPADVLAVTAQGVEAGDFSDLIAAIRNGLAYANVHTSRSPGGEIRGQIHRGAPGVKF